MENKDFIDFKKYFREYQLRFGLTGYSVYYEHKPLDDGFACIQYNVAKAVVTVYFDKGEHRSIRDIKRSAKHEAIHLLLARLESNANYRHSTSGEIQEATEELAVRLEELIGN